MEKRDFERAKEIEAELKAIELVDNFIENGQGQCYHNSAILVDYFKKVGKNDNAYLRDFLAELCIGEIKQHLENKNSQLNEEFDNLGSYERPINEQ